MHKKKYPKTIYEYIEILEKIIRSFQKSKQEYMFLFDGDVIENPTFSEDDGKIYLGGTRPKGVYYVIKQKDMGCPASYLKQLFTERISIYKKMPVQYHPKEKKPAIFSRKK